jgi:uncharacterized protein
LGFAPRTRCLLLAALAGCVAADPVAGTVVSIGSVQGPGDASPMRGATVTVAGIVTGDFQDHDADTGNNLGGFFITSAVADSDPASSEGLFVFEQGHESVDVAVGDRVRVTGKVQEYYRETQLLARTVHIDGRSNAAATLVALPVPATSTNADGDAIADLERYEGMLVRFPRPLVVTGVNELERFGTLELAAGGRLWQYTQVSPPDPEGYAAHRRANAGRRLLLDDGRRATNVWPVRFRLTATRTPTRIGDSVSGLVGNLRYARGSGGRGTEGWRLMPTAEPAIADSNPRPPAPAVGGDLRIASLNVLNYFSGLDAGEPRCGPLGKAPCRGANSLAEQQRQLAKIAASIAAMEPDVVGLIEIENNARQSLVDIVEALNRLDGNKRWDFVATGTIGRDAIRTGFIFRPARVRPVGPHAILDAGIDPRYDDSRNRPALAQHFAAVDADVAVTVVLVHLKSKGSVCDDIGDMNRGDGQGNCNTTRSRAAAALADWAATFDKSGDADILLLGDFNAYAREDPIRVLEQAGFVNLGSRARDSYSYVFDGQSGALDHALANARLLPRIAGFAEWHSNADEAPLYDYRLEPGRDSSVFAPSPYRASDHDPLLIGLDAGTADP